jgi:hypothetical protein
MRELFSYLSCFDVFLCCFRFVLFCFERIYFFLALAQAVSGAAPQQRVFFCGGSKSTKYERHRKISLFGLEWTVLVLCW